MITIKLVTIVLVAVVLLVVLINSTVLVGDERSYCSTYCWLISKCWNVFLFSATRLTHSHDWLDSTTIWLTHSTDSEQIVRSSLAKRSEHAALCTLPQCCRQDCRGFDWCVQYCTHCNHWFEWIMHRMNEWMNEWIESIARIDHTVWWLGLVKRLRCLDQTRWLLQRMHGVSN